MIAETACKLIEPFVDICYESDSKRFYQLLDLIQAKVWKKGVGFRGMIKEFHVNTRKTVKSGVTRRFIVTPHDYDNLLFINLHGEPRTIRNSYFEFHKNGPGSLNSYGRNNWTDSVVDLGESPVIMQPCDPYCNPCEKDCDVGYRRIGVLAHQDDYFENGLKTLVSGLYPDGTPIYSYSDPVYNHAKENGLTVSKEPVDSELVIHGVRFPISCKMVWINDVRWHTITSITKPPTRGPVRYYAISPANDSHIEIARIEPNQTKSLYRTYLLPESCNEYECIHGVFKRSKPSKIQSGTQQLIIDDEEALIALAISMKEVYSNKELGVGELFLQKGMQNLDEELTQTRSNDLSPIQVDDPWSDINSDW